MPGPSLPSPVGLPPSGAALSVDLKLGFDTGVPAKDRLADMHLVFPDVLYDQVHDVSVDLGVLNAGNDLSAPAENQLVALWKTLQNPDDVYMVAILLTVEFGYAGLYFVTGRSDPPDVDAVLPLPLVPGGFFFHVNDHDYELASNWHGSASEVPIYVQTIYSTTFLPTRITGRVWLKNKDV